MEKNANKERWSLTRDSKQSEFILAETIGRSGVFDVQPKNIRFFLWEFESLLIGNNSVK